MRRSINDEFKKDAVAFYQEHKGEFSVERVAKDLGISPSALNRWKADSRYQGGSPAKVKPNTTLSDIEEENKRLRKENTRLKEEREILKKAATFFAQEESNKRR